MAEGSGSGSRPTLGRLSTSSSAPDLQKLAAEGGAGADGGGADPQPNIQRLSAGAAASNASSQNGALWALLLCSVLCTSLPCAMQVTAIRYVSDLLKACSYLSAETGCADCAMGPYHPVLLGSCWVIGTFSHGHAAAVVQCIRLGQRSHHQLHSRRRHDGRHRGPRRRYVCGGNRAAAAAGPHRAAVPAAGPRR